MSIICFHHQDGHVDEVLGTERATMDILINKVSLSVFDFYASENHWTKNLFPARLYETFTAEILERCLSSFGYPKLNFGGKTWPTWVVRSNTAMLLGSDLVKLCVRIHNECEHWARVEGENRKWFAGLCESALSAGIFGKGVGWEQTIESIRSAEDSPVVMSFSVSGGFPTNEVVPSELTAGLEWHDLPYYRQWKLAIQCLRAQHSEIKPDGFDSHRYGDGIDFLKLREIVFSGASE